MTLQDRRRIEKEYERSYSTVRRTVLLMFLALVGAMVVELVIPSRPVMAATIDTSDVAP